MILILLGRFKRQDVFSTSCLNSINFDFFYLYPFILFLIFNSRNQTGSFGERGERQLDCVLMG